MIDGENSLLPLIHFDAQHGWADVERIGASILDSEGLRRLQACLGTSVQAVALEWHYIDRDYRDTFAGYHARRFSTPGSRCLRLHFFSHQVTRQNLTDTSATEPYYIGYSVIRPTRPNSIGRTMLKPEACPALNGFMRLTEERVNLQGTDLKVHGFPFISQDGDVTACAQSALWMILRYFADEYPNYREWHPHQITQLARDYSIGRILPSGGLTTWQIGEALRQAGFAPLIYDRSRFSDFDHLIYTYIESGIPIVACPPRHAIAVFGHTADYAQVNPGATRASEYATGLIASDDNGHPYQIVARQPVADPAVVAPRTTAYGMGDLNSFVVPLPERVMLSADAFEALVDKMLVRPDVGIAQSATLSALPKVFRRSYLTTARSFKRQIAARNMGHPDVEQLYRSLPMPHFIWVCELARHEDYVLHHKVLGEIIWDATRNPYEPDGWIVAHYPEKFLVDAGTCLNEPRQVRTLPLHGGANYSLYQSNLAAVQSV